MSNKNPNEISKLWKNAVDWPCHDGPHTYNGIHADTYINMYYGETSCYSEADAFASDIATSVPFVDPEDENRSVDMDVFDQMHTLWEVARLPFAVPMCHSFLYPLEYNGRLDEWYYRCASAQSIDDGRSYGHLGYSLSLQY